MDNVNKTLYIPLYGKAKVSQRGIILVDKTAETIWQDVAFPLKRRSRSKWLMYFMAMRARVFDDWVRLRMEADKSATVLHIGCGLDSRVVRVGDHNDWYDFDFDSVICERKKYYKEDAHYHMIVGDARDKEWLDSLPNTNSVIVVLEGVSMYLKNYELCTLLERLEKKYEHLNILMDVYTEYGAKMSKYKNPVKEVGVTEVYGVANPVLPISNTSIRYLAEHSMTPQYLVDELSGFDKKFFSAFFTGKLAKKTYRLYEYIK